MSCNQQQEMKQQRHLKKLSLLEEYNQYATYRPSRQQSQLEDQSLSYIDLLNEDQKESAIEGEYV